MNSNRGSCLWERVKTIIPGGNQLLSKKSERFLPSRWPAYYKHARGCEVWDLEGHRYIDFAQMGVGCCVLGYADPDVNAAVNKAVSNGSMCTLNCPEEVQLAERLLDIHTWADMARFARSGGEASAVAVRIARASSGKDKIAFCGYHGWCDWYLAANLTDPTHLDQQLLPGLNPAGVPKALAGTAIPFAYNRLDELEAIVASNPNDIGVIIMEPRRDAPPVDGFLEGVQEIARQIGAVLIFDEITSGFRMNVGGIHLTQGVAPDMAVFGKALGNGFAIAAVIGRKPVMECAQNTFISSTFWSERTGYAAALRTVEKMEGLDAPRHLVHCGERINAGWRNLADRHGLTIDVTGIPPLTHLHFVAEHPLAVQTFYTQEMLKRGFLVGAAVYTTLAYTDAVIDRFICESDVVFEQIAAALARGDLLTRLETPVINPGFKRLA